MYVDWLYTQSETMLVLNYILIVHQLQKFILKNW